MYVSKEMDYGLRIMSALASHPDKAFPDRDISKTFKIPFNFLSLILPKLMREGLVGLSQDQNKKNVYRIGKKPSAITVLEVLKAINGPLDLIQINKNDQVETEVFGSLMSMWEGLKTEIESHLNTITLDQCCVK